MGKATRAAVEVVAGYVSCQLSDECIGCMSLLLSNLLLERLQIVLPDFLNRLFYLHPCNRRVSLFAA
jgi:hypothetical protein